LSTKKTVTAEQVGNDPLWQYSGFELATMPWPKLYKLLHGSDSNRQYLPGMKEAYARKILEWKNQKAKQS
jgi:hypothetical protein